MKLKNIRHIDKEKRIRKYRTKIRILKLMRQIPLQNPEIGEECFALYNSFKSLPHTKIKDHRYYKALHSIYYELHSLKTTMCHKEHSELLKRREYTILASNCSAHFSGENIESTKTDGIYSEIIEQNEASAKDPQVQFSPTSSVQEVDIYPVDVYPKVMVKDVFQDVDLKSRCKPECVVAV